MALEKTKTPGVYLARGKKGRVAYRLYINVQISDSLSPAGFRWKLKSKTFAKYQEAVDAKVKTGAEVKAGKYIEPSNLTVKELLEKWLEAGRTRGVGKHGPWKIQTYLHAKSHIEQHIVPEMGDVKASTLKKAVIETAGGKWQTEKELSAKTVNKVYATMGAAYKWALKNPDSFAVSTNPLDIVERAVSRVSPQDIEALALGEIADIGEDQPESKAGAHREIQPDEVYSALELKKLIEAANPAMEKALLMTAIFTGVRHGELNGLRWPMLNLKRGILTINRSLTQLSKKHGGPRLERPKNKNAYRSLKLPQLLVTVLKRWQIACPPNPNHLVFVNEIGQARSRRQNIDTLKSCCERAGVRALSMNNLRHSYASQFLMENGTEALLELSRKMGHADPGVTLKVYSRWAKSEKSDADTRLASRIMEAPEEALEQDAAGAETPTV